jgi:nicotinamidase-related amidase
MRAFAQEQLPSERLLLAVDVQRDLWNPSREPIYVAIERAAERYRRTLIAVYADTQSLQRDDVIRAHMTTNVDDRFSHFPRFVRATFGVNPQRIAQELTEHRLEGVDVAGFDTGASVLITARALLGAGVDVRVRADLCGGLYHGEGLRLLRRDIGGDRLVVTP